MIVGEIDTALLFGPAGAQTNIAISSAWEMMNELVDGNLEFYIGYVPIVPRHQGRRIRQEFFAHWHPMKLWVFEMVDAVLDSTMSTQRRSNGGDRLSCEGKPINARSSAAFASLTHVDSQHNSTSLHRPSSDQHPAPADLTIRSPL
ncbi:MAG: hypothetical protein EOP24_31690 [Hyphomicrobiales bacterium]|nr:MAG: hypothetical protein EOP24_31690 [Hyphomicrobiales bacterium]